METDTLEVCVPNNIRELGDTLAALTGTQARDLGQYLKDTHGIVANETVVLQPSPGFPVPVAIVEEKTIFDVVLTGCDPVKKLTLIKAVRGILNLGLNELKQFVEAAMAGTPKVVKENAPTKEAEECRKLLEEAGGKVELK